MAVLQLCFKLLGLLVVLVTLLPLMPTGAWWVRAWDFPRVQTASFGLVVAVGLGATATKTGWRLDAAAVLAMVLASCLMQSAFIVRYLPAWPHTVPTGSVRDLRLLVVNLDVRNREHDAVVDMIRGTDPDLLLLIEIDDEWAESLGTLREAYAHSVEVIRGEGLGIALWSRHGLLDPRIRHMASDRRASIHSGLSFESPVPIRFVGMHPTPPGLAAREGEGRYDSRIRDAELVKIAREVGDSQAGPEAEAAWIVAGDFNDVAWSHTTRLFERLSGLRDPRVGRGLYNTYHARYPLMRYPLDHVFLSEHFRAVALRCVRTPGSDHFAVLADLEFVRTPAEDAEPSASRSEHEDAEELIEQGESDAVEQGE